LSTLSQFTTETDYKLERKKKPEEKQTNLAMEADNRKSSGTELENEEDDRKRGEVN
jgi:hypothetical protein